MKPIRFGLIGGGWRSEFFVRVARALPGRFAVSSVLVRDPEKASAFARRFDVKTCSSLDELMDARDQSFVVLCVRVADHPQMLADLALRGAAVLCETPPARDEAGMEQIFALHQNGLRIQVAEQLHLRPAHAARIAIARSGLLGAVTQAQVSVAHGYHGVSLLRRLLGVGFEDVKITAHRLVSSITAGPGRDGPPAADLPEKVVQELAWLDFGGRLGVFDFSSSQYFSWIRSTRVLVQGDRGEIANDELRYLKDFQTPIHSPLRREAAGEGDNLEGHFLKGIQAGGQWFYRNPFVPAALSDDEIAVASCLDGMARYVEDGTEFYSLAEACQDNYLARLITEAGKSGEPRASSRQVWAP